MAIANKSIPYSSYETDMKLNLVNTLAHFSTKNIFHSGYQDRIVTVNTVSALSDLIDKNGLLGGNEASYLLSQNRFLFRKKKHKSNDGIYLYIWGREPFFLYPHDDESSNSIG
ncbi:hypothetical protein [Candidatus Liberibacter solanacearum]|uniref:Uncharacterized protein n=1 Tax=Candidatus Liberibacter solanacearum TaxID=556287 RepID=A0A1V2N925_9HYPH|nr:hypothetical protein [Candidatus Liberibacter solanacearum]ONI58509.1 hypothetical protein AYJ09_04965 [Candidatus Liberibacter solanacearum]ONI60236.1 hypothetical protein AYO25_00825 [Candidatus Liberibacter solanacearum]